ncbi:MAG: phosphate ABC transporter permease subunit PstC [Bacteroidetes bacterium]|nr:phosphate ABC transporter permease subunit PstC [Bacteroidota bacterium]
MYKLRILKDKIMSIIMQSLTGFALLLMFIIGGGLLYKAWPILSQNGLFNMLTSETWRPFKGQFGFLSYIMGTIWIAVIGISIAFPLCLLTGVYLSEYASNRIRSVVVPLIDLLAGVPPVVYGVWGVLTIVPFIGDTLAPHFVEYSSGYSVLAGGIVLSIMTFPLIISILREVFAAIPNELRDASLSLGATKWQTTKLVVIRKALPGIIAAVVLAISRALGETIAVLMVCGNIAAIPHSIFDSCYPLPALIANNYGEMLSVPMYESALMLAAFILFIIIVVFNAVSRLTLARLERRFKL